MSCLIRSVTSSQSVCLSVDVKLCLEQRKIFIKLIKIGTVKYFYPEIGAAPINNSSLWIGGLYRIRSEMLYQQKLATSHLYTPLYTDCKMESTTSIAVKTKLRLQELRWHSGKTNMFFNLHSNPIIKMCINDFSLKFWFSFLTHMPMPLI